MTTFFIEVTEYENTTDTTCLKKATINPEYIVAIEDDDKHSIIHLSNGAVIQAVETRSEIINMFSKLNKYIG